MDGAGLLLVPAPSQLRLRTGVASVVVSFFLSMYYNVINAWAFWYLFHSFQVSWPCPSRAPWGTGGGGGGRSRAPWGTGVCVCVGGLKATDWGGGGQEVV